MNKHVCYLLVESAVGILKGTDHQFLKKFRHRWSKQQMPNITKSTNVLNGSH